MRDWFRSPPDKEPVAAVGGLIYLLDQGVAERYRTLAWTLEQLRQKQDFKVLTVTSSVSGEGKSTLAANLAAVLAERDGRRVLLIDCDMRRPRQHEMLGGEPPGLVEVLTGECELHQAIHRHPTLKLSYIPVVEPHEDPLVLLADSPRMGQLVALLREHYDYIIMDAPPVLPVSDPLFLTELSDAVLFVVRAGESSGRMLSRSLSMIRPEKLLGLVFNGTARGIGYAYERYYRKGYGYRTRRIPRSKTS
jgi:capsular exopolysaccharide synthesis family protein